MAHTLSADQIPAGRAIILLGETANDLVHARANEEGVCGRRHRRGKLVPSPTVGFSSAC